MSIAILCVNEGFESAVHDASSTYDVAKASEEPVLDLWAPADRFIAATVRVLAAQLKTADERAEALRQRSPSRSTASHCLLRRGFA